MLLLSSVDFFQKNFQEHYQSVKWIGSKSGLSYYQSLSGFKLFAKVISRRHVAASKERVSPEVVRKSECEFWLPDAILCTCILSSLQ